MNSQFGADFSNESDYLRSVPILDFRVIGVVAESVTDQSHGPGLTSAKLKTART